MPEIDEPSTETEEIDIPSWALGTPTPLSYSLIMYNPWGNSGAEQNIDLDREEFIALKLHLAEVRGYPLTPEQKEKTLADEDD